MNKSAAELSEEIVIAAIQAGLIVRAQDIPETTR